MEKNNKIIQFKRNFKKKKDTNTTSGKRGFGLFNEGLFFYKQNKDELALKKFQAAEEDGYESSEMFGYMGWLYGHFEQYDKSRTYAQKAIDIDPEYGFPYCVLANSYFMGNNDSDQTLKYFLLAEKYGFNDDEVMMRKISLLYNQQNNYLRAIEYTNKAIKIDPQNAYSKYWKGYIYFSNEDYKNALIYYKKAEAMGQSDFSLYYEMSYCYSCLEDHKKGLEYANKSIFLDKEYPMGYYRKGFAYFQAGDDEHALEPFLQAEKLGCKEQDMYARIAYLYGTKNINDKAFEYADKAIKADRKASEGYIIKANIYGYNLKDYKSALKPLKKAYILSEGNADVNFYANYITALSYLNRHKKSMELVNEALEKFPENYDLISIKISLLQFTKKYKEAEILTQKLIEIDPDNHWTIYTKALTYYNCKKKDRNYDKVIELLLPIKDEQAICDFGGSKAVLAFCYCEKKDYEKSLEYLLEFAKQPESEEFFVKNKKELQKYFKKLSQKTPADKRLEKIAKIFPQIKV